MLVVIVVLRAFSEISSQLERYNPRGCATRAFFNGIPDPRDCASPEIDSFIASIHLHAGLGEGVTLYIFAPLS